jgi:hypothetical protein
MNKAQLKAMGRTASCLRGTAQTARWAGEQMKSKGFSRDLYQIEFENAAAYELAAQIIEMLIYGNPSPSPQAND